MLKRTIRNIRQKPKAVRDRYAFWIAISFTSLVILIWVITIPDRFGDTGSLEAESQIERPGSVNDVISEFQSKVETIESEMQSFSEPSATPTVPVQTSVGTTTSPTTVQEVRIATFTATTTSE